MNSIGTYLYYGNIDIPSLNSLSTYVRCVVHGFKSLRLDTFSQNKIQFDFILYYYFFNLSPLLPPTFLLAAALGV